MDNIVITSYFVNDVTKKDCDLLLYKWNNSRSNHNLNAIIFYDNLSQSFIDKYQNQTLMFMKYERKYNLSVNDERFICYYEYLLRNKHHKYIIFTDLFDCWFNKNPFDFIINNSDYDIFYSSEDKKIKNSSYTMNKMISIYNKTYNKGHYLLNAGVWGGSYHNVILLLFNISLDLIHYNLPHNVGLGVFNKWAYNIMNDTNKYIGHPFNSKFKKYEEYGDFYIAHK